MIHMTPETMQWIIDKKDDPEGTSGVSHSYPGMKGLCGQTLEGWGNDNACPQMHLATAIAYYSALAEEYKVGLGQLFSTYVKVTCPKCIAILKNNGL